MPRVTRDTAESLAAGSIAAGSLAFILALFWFF